MLTEHVWTPDFVDERLIGAFAFWPNTPIRSAVKGDFRDLSGRPIKGSLIIGCAQQCLGRESPECIALLTWAARKALSGPAWATSIRERCEAMRWSERAFYERKERGSKRLAAWLNERKAEIEKPLDSRSGGA